MGDAYDVEPSKIKPLPTQTTLLLVNQFVVQTTMFLNSFSETIEKKISKVSSRVTELEILLAVFEAKLNSIPGGSDSSPASAPAPAAAAAAPSSSSTPPPPTAPPGQKPPPPPAGGGGSGGAHTAGSTYTTATATATTASADTEEGGGSVVGPMVKDHPDYAKFFKMLKVCISVTVQ